MNFTHPSEMATEKGGGLTGSHWAEMAGRQERKASESNEERD